MDDKNLNVFSAVPDKPGFWWWREKGKKRWELTEAREITPGKINLYSMEKTWGGYTHEEAEKSLPGDWLFVSRPDETQVDNNGTIPFVPTPPWVQEFLKKARQELDKTKEENNVR